MAIIPVAAVGLEVILNAVQALIFSVLTLMFTLAAIEGHHSGRAATSDATSNGDRDDRVPDPSLARLITSSSIWSQYGPGTDRDIGGMEPMEHLGAGLAALGVIGPGIGIGILAGMSSSAIGRNPDAAGQIRGLAIILAASPKASACSRSSSAS